MVLFGRAFHSKLSQLCKRTIEVALNRKGTPTLQLSRGLNTRRCEVVATHHVASCNGVLQQASSQGDRGFFAQNVTNFDCGEEGDLLPPLPSSIRNRISEYNVSPLADPDALDNDAFYFPALFGCADDLRMYERLFEELNFRSCWLENGVKFSRDICLGDEEVLSRAPMYRAIVHKAALFFNVRVVRTLANIYRDGNDWCNLHSDQYHRGGYPINFTIGVSFGHPRRLIWVEKRNQEHAIELPQCNGDVFAFSNMVNDAWRHMIPQETSDCGPRISIIIWCNRSLHKRDDLVGPSALLATPLGRFPHMFYRNPRECDRRTGRRGSELPLANDPFGKEPSSRPRLPTRRKGLDHNLKSV